MPIIVNEVVIKGTVVDSASTRPRDERRGRPARSEQVALIEACVEAVLRVLERENER